MNKYHIALTLAGIFLVVLLYQLPRTAVNNEEPNDLSSHSRLPDCYRSILGFCVLDAEEISVALSIQHSALQMMHENGDT